MIISTAILIILAILVIVIIAYFVIKKRTTLLTLEKLTDPPLPIMDRSVGQHVNLLPGTLAPLSGNYECIISATGGLQDSTEVALFWPRGGRSPCQVSPGDKDIVLKKLKNCRPAPTAGMQLDGHW